jgi:hypothetical protein
MTDFGVSVVTEREGDAAGHPAPSGDGEFFIVDRRAFAAACKLGLNPAVAYLTIARGAGCRRTSLWSVDAIERRTGISRPKAKLAVNTVIENGLLTLERRGTRPVYGIVAAHELQETHLSADDQMVLKVFGGAEEARIAQRHVSIAADLVRRGILKNIGNRWFSKNSGSLSGEPQYVWLPNAIVDGAGDETPPLALLRQMQDIRCLQLFVALYDCSDLPNEGGVLRSLLHATHILTKISERGACTIWRFGEPGNRSAAYSLLSEPFLTGKCGEDGRDTGAPDFWAALAKVEACGLLTFIPHVFESDKPEGEMLHAYPVGDEAGEEWERSVADAADAAARSLLTSDQQKRATENKHHFLPIPSHINPAVIGIARLRYRPQTRKTAAWFAMSKERSEAWQRRYDLIIRSRDP